MWSFFFNKLNIWVKNCLTKNSYFKKKLLVTKTCFLTNYYDYIIKHKVRMSLKHESFYFLRSSIYSVLLQCPNVKRFFCCPGFCSLHFLLSLLPMMFIYAFFFLSVQLKYKVTIQTESQYILDSPWLFSS